MVNTRVAQVSNVSSAATMDQLRTLFGFLGKIEDIRLFPKEDSVLPVTVRICFVRFEDPTSVGMAQHLSNTVFLDKALSVVPFPDGVIPEESKALQMVAASAGGLVNMMNNAGASLLPTPPQPLLGHLSGVTGVSVATGIDPAASLAVPMLPPLTNVDPSKVEEIRRTVYVGNLDSGTVTAEQLLTFFQKVGEVKYVRMAGDETQPTRFAFVEFSEPTSVQSALGYNGVMFAGRPLKINHSNNAIVKPPGKTQEAIQKELAQTMKQVRDAQALIQAAIDPALIGSEAEKLVKKKSRSRSPSKKKSRSRSRSRRRSRSRDRRRSRSRGSISRSRRRSRSPRRRSPVRRRSRSRSRHRRSRSRSKERRSRSKEKRKRSKTPPRGYRARRSRSRSKGKNPESSRPRRRSRSPSPAARRRSRSKSGSKSPRRSSKHRKDKKRDKSRERDRKDKDKSSSSSRKKKDKESVDKEPSSTSAPAGDDEKEEKNDSKIKRDYDEEEKGFDNQEQEKETSTTAATADETADNVNTEDMDMDSD